MAQAHRHPPAHEAPSLSLERAIVNIPQLWAIQDADRTAPCCSGYTRVVHRGRPGSDRDLR